jgi:hypothetical protein
MQFPSKHQYHISQKKKNNPKFLMEPLKTKNSNLEQKNTKLEKLQYLSSKHSQML